MPQRTSLPRLPKHFREAYRESNYQSALASIVRVSNWTDLTRPLRYLSSQSRRVHETREWRIVVCTELVRAASTIVTLNTWHLLPLLANQSACPDESNPFPLTPQFHRALRDALLIEPIRNACKDIGYDFL